MRKSTMIDIDGKIVSSDILTEPFLCDLSRCRGICCVEGDSGAPLEADEAEWLARNYETFSRYMTPEGRSSVARQGYAVTDADGDLTTPLCSSDTRCAYACQHDGQMQCAIERAFLDGVCDFRKPVSCHLYPIRVLKFSDGSMGLNYHRWNVCAPARELGRRKGVPVYRMLRQALERAFGEDFYQALEQAAEYLRTHDE